MNVRDVQELLDAEVASGEAGLDREVTGGYCGDLLSDVMGKASAGMVWVTIQSHQNVVAVALLKDLAAIVLANAQRPDEDTAIKSEAERIPVLVTQMSAFEVAGRLFAAVGDSAG